MSKDMNFVLKLGVTVFLAGLMFMFVATSTDSKSSSEKRLSIFLGHSLGAQDEREERKGFDLNEISYEELESLNAEFDENSRFARNYNLESALSAKVTKDMQTETSVKQETNTESQEVNVDLQEAPEPFDDNQSIYTVKEGDTYACIAEQFYGNYKVWGAIRSNNPGEGFEETTLHIGAKLDMPEITSPEVSTSICS